MEGPSAGLRSRSRSRTPSVDVEKVYKSGRKTPLGRNTPVKQLSKLMERSTPEPILEETYTSPPAHRTRSSAATLTADNIQTKEQFQNAVNSVYEHSRTQTTRHTYYETAGFSDHLSPSKHSSPYVPQHVSPLQRSFSPTHSACSTDSSFAEQALADVSRVIETDPHREHLPYRLYKMAGEYWNKYPKTDYTYSPLSRDRVELAPGQVAVPNMSRRSLAHYRAVGDLTNSAELERLLRQHNAWTERSYESSEDECLKKRTNGAYSAFGEERRERWWFTRAIIAVYSALSTAVSSAYSKVRGENVYTARYGRQQQAGVASRAAAALASPFLWLYRVTKTVVTTTTTTITNTLWGSEQTDGPYYARREVKRRRWWPWLLLLPLIFYGSHYAYENRDNLTPDFSAISLDLPEFTVPTLPSLAEIFFPSMPEISLPAFSLPSLPKLPDLELPELPELPEIPEAVQEYGAMAADRASDAAEYVKVVAGSCVEQMRRIWNAVY